MQLPGPTLTTDYSSAEQDSKPQAVQQDDPSEAESAGAAAELSASSDGESGSDGGVSDVSMSEGIIDDSPEVSAPDWPPAAADAGTATSRCCFWGCVAFAWQYSWHMACPVTMCHEAAM